MSDMKGEDRLRSTANAIKKEVEAEKAENALELVRANEELAQMYRENAEVGSANLSGELPLLKVHSVGKSHTNELADGSEPTDGYFFYKPTREQFKEITCHILTISGGFRAKGLEEDKEVFNQIVGGVIVNEETNGIKPFILYMTGLKLSNLWKFGKEASKYTKAKPVPIPMFALTIKLTTEKVTNSYGQSWIINFEIVKDEEGVPQVVTDVGLFQFLKDHVASLESTIQNVIRVKGLPENEEAPLLNEDENGPSEPIPF